MTHVAAPICVNCPHYRPSDDGLNCRVFPRGIPGAILDGSHDHHEPYPGDGGVTYESVKGRAPSIVMGADA